MEQLVNQIVVPKTKELVSVVPGVFWAINKPLNLIYKDFSTDESLVNKKIISSRIQAKCTQRFLSKPNKPQTYMICSSPDYNAAMVFAGYLVNEFIKKYGASRIIWHHMNKYTPDPFVASLEYRPSLIVLSALYPDTSYQRVEQFRDLISFYWNVPKLIIGTGMDPLTLAATKLHVPVNSVFYHQSRLVKTNYNVM